MQPASLAGMGSAAAHRHDDPQQRDLYKFAHDQTIPPDEPRTDRDRDRRGYPACRKASTAPQHARLLQSYQAQCEGDLPKISRLVRRQSGQSRSAAAGRVGEVCRVSWARRRSWRAAKDFARGEFRFVAQAVSHLVFAEPDNRAARELLADTFEQLGYAAESSTWRNAYLFGAQELRQGMPKAPPRAAMPRETLAALRTEQLWDVLGVRLNGPGAEGRSASC